MPGVFLLAPGAVYQDPNAQPIHANATVTANGEAVVTGYGATEVTLFINVKAAPTGGSPTLQYTIREVDPGDGVTVIGPTVTSTSITGVGIQKISLVATFGGSIVVAWTVGGTTPSFTQVYATMVGKDGSVALVDATGVAISSANPLRTDPTGSTTQPVSGTFWQTTQPVSGTVTANQGTQGTHAQRWMTGLSDGSGFISPATDRTTAAGPFSFRLSDGAAFYDAAKTGQLPAALVGGRLDENLGSWLGSTAPTVGSKTSANSIPIVIASDQAAIPVSQSGTWTVQQGGSPWGVDVSDRAARLLGIVYGSQGQQLKQTATNFNLQTEIAVGATLIDPRLIRALTSSDVVTSNQGTAAALSGYWPVRITDGTNVMPTGDDVARSVFNQISDGAVGPVAVKPASTAAGVSDKALTVTMSPNSAALPVSFTPPNSVQGVSAGVRILGGGTANTLQKVQATTYTEPAAAAQRSMASASALDTAAGTGARTVRITYYDGTGAGPFTETITLNGVTPVNTVATNIRFIENMVVLTVGSSGVNAGIITLFGATGGGGGTVGTIGVGNVVAAIGDNRTWWAHHYVAIGQTAKFSVLVCGIQSGGSGTYAQFFLRTQQPLIANSAEVALADSVLTIGAFERIFSFYPVVIGFARVSAYFVPGVNNTVSTCSFDWSETPT